jgi:hypothetical protein
MMHIAACYGNKDEEGETWHTTLGGFATEEEAYGAIFTQLVNTDSTHIPVDSAMYNYLISVVPTVQCCHIHTKQLIMMDKSVNDFILKFVHTTVTEGTSTYKDIVSTYHLEDEFFKYSVENIDIKSKPTPFVVVTSIKMRDLLRGYAHKGEDPPFPENCTREFATMAEFGAFTNELAYFLQDGGWKTENLNVWKTGDTVNTLDISTMGFYR